ncbi:MAG: beta-ketoacyl-ACP synthase II [Verrucomicrobiota bacterium]
MTAPASSQRVVVTGMGAITPLGNTVEAFWSGLIEGRSGLSRIQSFDVSDLPCQVGGEVRDFDPSDWMDAKETKRNDRYTHFAVAAAKMAWAEAALSSGSYDPDRFGCIIGTGIGGLDTIEKQTFRLWEGGPRRVSPFMIPMLIGNMASGVVAIELGAKGPNYGVVSACATASHALGDAVRMLRAGEADVMLAGGAEASATRLGFAGFCNMKAMATRFNDTPETASRPFDAERDGFVMGEGAGILLLETLEHAEARGATILAELVGHGATCDAHHITSPAPGGEGLARCLQRALKDAGLAPEAIDYINAHGTSTPYNDKNESIAIKTVFGEHAHALKVSSTKSMTGHLLGAAGGIEAIATILALREGIVPPTINYTAPDPDCDLDYVPNQAQRQELRYALSSNLGFGGQNGVVVFRRWED